jgi:hypothetical protein
MGSLLKSYSKSTGDGAVFHTKASKNKESNSRDKEHKNKKEEKESEPVMVTESDKTNKKRFKDLITIMRLAIIANRKVTGKINVLKEANKKLKTKDNVTLTAFDNDEELIYMTLAQITAAVGRTGLNEWDILCDNQASVSIFHNAHLLSNGRKSKKSIRVSGIGGQIVVDKVGDMPGFGEVYFHPESIANILCFHDLASKYKVRYDSNEDYFEVIINIKAIKFEVKGKLYIWNAKVGESEIVLVDTVEYNQKLFTKRKITQAKEVRLTQRRLGYPSVQDIIYGIKHKTILNIPVTVRDFENAVQMWGPDLGSLKGKSVPA